MANIARGQITINNLDTEHTYHKWSDDLKTFKFDNPRYRQVDGFVNPYRYLFYISNNKYKISDKLRIVIEFTIYKRSNNNSNTYVFGNYNADQEKQYFLRLTTDDYLYAVISATGAQANNHINIPYQLGERIKVDMDFNRIIVNDNDIYEWPAECDRTPFEASYLMRFFNGTKGNSVISNNTFMVGAIHHIQIWYDNILVHDAIPAIDLQNTRYRKMCTMINTLTNTEDAAYAGQHYKPNMSYIDGIESENRLINSNFSQGFLNWQTNKMGDYMTAEIVNDEAKGTCLKFKSTDTTTIDANNNNIYDSLSSNSSFTNNTWSNARYWFRNEIYFFAHKTVVSFDAKASADGARLTVNRRNINNIYDDLFTDNDPVVLSTQWKRYVKYGNIYNGGENNIYFAPNDANIDYYITNIKIEYSEDATPWTPSPDDVEDYEVTGKYLGTLVWDKEYPSENFDDYTWVQIEGSNGTDAETYDLQGLTEKAVVSKNGTLQLDFTYNVKHIKGDNVENVTASSDGYHIIIVPDYGTAINLSVNTETPSYTNDEYITEYHKQENKPTSFNIQLMNGEEIVMQKYVPIIFDAGAALEITDSITATVQGNTTKLANLEVGGRNLIFDSAFDTFQKWGDWGDIVDYDFVTNNNQKFFHFTSQSIFEGCYQNTSLRHNGTKVIDILPNRYYTFSVNAYGTGKFGFLIHFQDNTQNISEYRESFDLTSENKRYVSTFKVPDNSAIKYFNIMIGSLDNNTNEIYFSQPQLEIGTMATDWKKAPEDEEEVVNNVINSVAQVNIEMDNITSTVEQVQTNYNDDTNNVFGTTVYNGGELNTNNKWELVNNGVTVINNYARYGAIIYNGQADWQNYSSGTSYLYSPYIIMASSVMYTLCLKWANGLSKSSLEVVSYSSSTDAINMVNGTSETIMNFNDYTNIDVDQVIQFTKKASGTYARLRFCNITENYDADEDDYWMQVGKIRLYRGQHAASDFPAFNMLQAKAFSQITQTAKEIEFKVANTGINIEEGKITLNAANTNIVGNLNLKDSDQGLVIYDEYGNPNISIINNKLGNLDNFDFGDNQFFNQYFDSYSSTVTVDTFDLGTFNQGSKMEIIKMQASIDNATNVSFTYVIKCGTTVISTVNGNATYNDGFWNFPNFTHDITITGNYTLDLTYTVSGVTGKFHNFVFFYSRRINSNINKVATDGAVFASSTSKFNWMGQDQTYLRNEESILRLKDGRLQRNNYDSQNNVSKNTFSDLTSTVPYAIIKSLTYTATVNDALIVFSSTVPSSSSQRVLTLPNPNTCAGKIYYVKNIEVDSTKVTTSGADDKYFISASSTSSSNNVTVGNKASMFISCNLYWLHYYCG